MNKMKLIVALISALNFGVGQSVQAKVSHHAQEKISAEEGASQEIISFIAKNKTVEINLWFIKSPNLFTNEKRFERVTERPN